MYVGGLVFNINKSFASLQLVPLPQGLRMCYMPKKEGYVVTEHKGFLDIVLPLEAISGLWATARAFLYGVEALDENIILQGGANEGDVLIKLYRDKPRGPRGKLTGDEACWLRLVTGRDEEERRRIKLGPRDLLSLELACQSVLALAAAKGTHLPVKEESSEEE